MRELTLFWVCAVLSSSYTFSQDFMEKCDQQLQQVQMDKQQLNEDYELGQRQINQGLICSECKKPKYVIEKTLHTSFEDHLTKVEGEAIQASMKDIREAFTKFRDNYERDWENLENKGIRIEEDCNRRIIEFYDNQKKEQERLEQEKKEEEERKRQALIAQLEAEKRAREVKMLRETKQLTNHIRNTSRQDMQNTLEEITYESEEIRDMDIGGGIADEKQSFSFDKEELNETLSGLSLDDEDFDPNTDLNNVLEGLVDGGSKIEETMEVISHISSRLEEVSNSFINKVGEAVLSYTDATREKINFSFGSAYSTGNNAYSIGSNVDWFITESMDDIMDYENWDGNEWNRTKERLNTAWTNMADGVIGYPIFSWVREEFE